MISSSHPPEHDLTLISRFGSADARGRLLTEVDFKWLMAGQGWWINTGRFHADAAYAAALLRLALSSGCAALRECATVLSAQCDAPPGGDGGPGIRG
jgi:hypothetical protein